MKDWDECPEAAGPQSEGVLINPATGTPADYGQPGYPSIGRIEPPLSPEMRDRERAAAAALYERRQAIERAAIAAGLATLTGGQDAADKLLAEAADIAQQAAMQP